MYGDDLSTSRAVKRVEVVVSAGARKALVIGVEKYFYLPILPNAVNDAVRLKSTLQQLGWSVEAVLDPDKESVDTAIAKFSDLVRDSNHPCLFAFVGHGVELQGENFFLPVDFRHDDHYISERRLFRDVESKAVSLTDVGDYFKAIRPNPTDSQATIFVLDCCRCGIEASVGDKTRAIPTIAPHAGQISTCLLNSCIVYSTNKGSRASDGVVGRGGPFMTAFSEEITFPDAAIEDVVMKTRNRLLKHSTLGKIQVVEFVSKLTAKFYPNPLATPRPGAKIEVGITGAAGAADEEGEVDPELRALLREFKIERIAGCLAGEGLDSVPNVLIMMEDEDAPDFADKLASSTGLRFFERTQFKKLCVRVQAKGSPRHQAEANTKDSPAGATSAVGAEEAGQKLQGGRLSSSGGEHPLGSSSHEEEEEKEEEDRVMGNRASRSPSASRRSKSPAGLQSRSLGDNESANSSKHREGVRTRPLPGEEVELSDSTDVDEDNKRVQAALSAKPPGSGKENSTVGSQELSERSNSEGSEANSDDEHCAEVQLLANGGNIEETSEHGLSPTHVEQLHLEVGSHQLVDHHPATQPAVIRIRERRTKDRKELDGEEALDVRAVPESDCEGSTIQDQSTDLVDDFVLNRQWGQVDKGIKESVTVLKAEATQRRKVAQVLSRNVELEDSHAQVHGHITQVQVPSSSVETEVEAGAKSTTTAAALRKTTMRRAGRNMGAALAAARTLEVLEGGVEAQEEEQGAIQLGAFLAGGGTEVQAASELQRGQHADVPTAGRAQGGAVVEETQGASPSHRSNHRMDPATTNMYQCFPSWQLRSLQTWPPGLQGTATCVAKPTAESVDSVGSGRMDRTWPKTLQPEPPASREQRSNVMSPHWSKAGRPARFQVLSQRQEKSVANSREKAGPAASNACRGLHSSPGNDSEQDVVSSGMQRREKERSAVAEMAVATKKQLKQREGVVVEQETGTWQDQRTRFEEEQERQSLACAAEVKPPDWELKMLQAAETGDVQRLKTLLDCKCTPDTAHTTGQSVLYKAVFLGSTEVVDCLLRFGVNANLCCCVEEETAAYAACVRGHSKLLEKLALHGADLSSVNRNGASAAWVAAFEGQLACLKTTANLGVSLHTAPNSGEYAGCSVAWAAACNGHLGCLSFAVDRRVDLNSTACGGPFTGATAAWMCAYGGHQKCLEIIEANHGDLITAPISGKFAGVTPLQIAQDRNNEECHYLLESYGCV